MLYRVFFSKTSSKHFDCAFNNLNLINPNVKYQCIIQMYIYRFAQNLTFIRLKQNTDNERVDSKDSGGKIIFYSSK